MASGARLGIAHGNSRSNFAIKELCFQTGLSISNSDHIGRNIADMSPACVSMMGRAVKLPALI